MKKIISILSLFLFMALFQNALAGEEKFFGIGAELFQDPFNKKVIITNVFQNSPAEKAGIMAGGEIVSIDGNKVRKMSCICDIISRIRGQEGTPVKIVVKNSWWDRKTYEIIRGQVVVPIPDENPSKEAYWRQIAPIQYAYSKCFPEWVLKKLSLAYQRKIAPINAYWIERRQKFDIGYNTCMSYSKNNQEICLMDLLNRENQITLFDKKIFKYLRYIKK